MGLFFGVLSFENGFVIVTDIMPNSLNASHIIQVNPHNVIALANDIDFGTKFCEQYITGLIKENDGIYEIVDLANKAFTNLDKKYQGKILTIHFFGYDSKLQEKISHSIMYDGKKVIYNSPAPVQQKTMFTFEVNLGTFIVNKVYSNYMSVQDAINLMAYVSTQYRILYPEVIGKSINMLVISEAGMQILTEKEVKDVLNNSEKIDMQIRKDCFNFFLTNEVGIKK